MKLAVASVIGIGLLSSVTFAATTSTTVVSTPSTTVTSTVTGPLQTPRDKLSYAIGVDMGNGFKRQNIDINAGMIVQGMQDVLTGNKLLMTEQEVRSTLVDVQKQIMAKREAEFKQMGEKNLQDGNAFLAANKTKPSVVTTTSGLQYKIIKEGKGVSPTDKDLVTVDYQGSFIDGKVFDSSYQRGKSVTFGVTDVIPGWTQALKMMKPGATWEVYVPANLAYGSNGMPPVIGPNQTLIFKINLIAVNKKQ
jgi:FKBP-type peptidyl-prolyl cis-trans isomerase FklB